MTTPEDVSTAETDHSASSAETNGSASTVETEGPGWCPGCTLTLGLFVAIGIGVGLALLGYGLWSAAIALAFFVVFFFGVAYYDLRRFARSQRVDDPDR